MLVLVCSPLSSIVSSITYIRTESIWFLPRLIMCNCGRRNGTRATRHAQEEAEMDLVLNRRRCDSRRSCSRMVTLSSFKVFRRRRQCYREPPRMKAKEEDYFDLVVACTSFFLSWSGRSMSSRPALYWSGWFAHLQLRWDWRICIKHRWLLPCSWYLIPSLLNILSNQIE